MFTHEPFWLIISILWTYFFTWLSLLLIHHRFWSLHASIRWLVCPESFELPRCRLPSVFPFNHTCFPRVVTLLLWLVNQPTLRHIKALIAFSLMSQHTWRSVYILFMTVTPTVTVRLNSSYHTCQSDDSFVRNLSSYPGFAVSHFSRSILFWFPPVGTLLLLLFHPLTLRHIKALVAFSLASHSTWRSVHIFSIKAAPTALSRLRIPMRVIFDWYFPPLIRNLSYNIIWF